MLTPVGFISSTIAQHRYEEEISRVALSDAEVNKLIDGAASVKDRRFQVLIRLLVETGGRKSEVAERKWKDIDHDAGSIEVLNTKTGKSRILFFIHQTADLMKRVWANRVADGMLFESTRAPVAVVNSKMHWTKLTTAIGRDDLRLHDLRHYRAKLLIESGSTVAVAAQALGHSSLILHRRYGQMESQALQNAVQTSWRKQ